MDMVKLELTDSPTIWDAGVPGSGLAHRATHSAGPARDLLCAVSPSFSLHVGACLPCLHRNIWSQPTFLYQPSPEKPSSLCLPPHGVSCRSSGQCCGNCVGLRTRAQLCSECGVQGRPHLVSISRVPGGVSVTRGCRPRWSCMESPGPVSRQRDGRHRLT